MTETIDLTLKLDGWNPTVRAEPMLPTNLGLAVHPDPWSLQHVAPGEPPPDHCHWCVTDIVTGCLVAIERKRSRAISEALRRLRLAAEARDCEIPELLAALRRTTLH